MSELEKTFVVEGPRIDFRRQGGIPTPPKNGLRAAAPAWEEVEATTTLTNTDMLCGHSFHFCFQGTYDSTTVQANS